jgi:zinc D-Ala-D-Ala carboxypeptidase
MSHIKPALVRLGIVAALTGLVGCGAPATSSPQGAGPVLAAPSGHHPHELLGTVPGRLQSDRHGALGVADGELPGGATVFADYPGVTRLDPALLGALRAAARDARGDGVETYVNSGWRSRAYQEQLLDEAVAKYGSRAEAARWVATPATSPHVSGEAVDLGETDATEWLAEHGARHGLCQIYDNEPWHYELRPDAVEQGCPSRYADPTHDPRMQP